MDHHCPWTSNCVSHFTFPHFIRFLFYAVVGMGYLETLLWERGSIVWKSRDLPSVRNPTDEDHYPSTDLSSSISGHLLDS